MQRHLKWLWLSLFVVIIDQLSKYYMVSHLQLASPQAVLPFLNFTLAYNTGAAFSFLSKASGWQLWFFSGLALAIGLFIIGWLWRRRSPMPWLACALSLVLGGAVGNLIDRMSYGYVIDFIDVYYRHWHWYDFNVADSAITVGAVMMAIDVIWGAKEQS